MILKRIAVLTKYIPEQIYYFSIFVLLALFLIVGGYAAFVTNDDWMLYNLLLNKGTYGTLMMGYPLSYIVSRLYDLFPSVQWYSLLLSSILLLYSYLIALYIARADTTIRKVLLFISALLLIAYLWLHMTITALSIVAMIISLGFAKKNLFYSFIFLFLFSLLRSDLLLSLLPFWIIGILLIRDHLDFSRRDFYALVALVLLISLDISLQKLDKEYALWLKFNDARALTVDMHVLDTSHILSKEQKFLLVSGWIQDSELLPSPKVIQANSESSGALIDQLLSFDYLQFSQYRLAGWLYLLLAMSLLLMYQNRNSWRVLLPLLFIAGVFAMIVIRDVDRVTIPLFAMWAFILLESLKGQKTVKELFLLLFVLFFAYYSYPSFGYRFFKENTQLKHEARKLIKDSGIACEISMNFPTLYNTELLHIIQSNFLFREKDWLKINKSEILPGFWLSRLPFFYETHNISHNGIKRKFNDYHEFLIDRKSGFIGGKELQKSRDALFLLQIYDKYYLQDKPECRHQVYIVAKSEHFAISQIRIDCR